MLKNIAESLFAALATTSLLSAMSAIARADEIFVTNYNGGFGQSYIGEYDVSGAAINTALIGGQSGPTSIAVSGGNLFVTNWQTGTVGEYNATTGATVNASLVTGLDSPEGIAISGNDLFVTEQNNLIGEYTTSGAVVNASLISDPGAPTGIAISGDDLFVTNYSSRYNSISEYTTGGGTVNASLVTGLESSQALAVLGGDLFVTNFGNGTIGEYTTGGATVNASLVSGLGAFGPDGIAASGNDLFVVVDNPDSSSARIGEYNATTGATINAAFITGLNGSAGIALVTPEPSTSIMLAIGAAALLACRIRKRR